MHVAVILGTRPEVIKMAPVIRALKAHGTDVSVLATGQHTALLEQQLKDRGVEVASALALSRSNDGLFDLTAGLVLGLGVKLEEMKPDVVLVQGDTTSALAGALSAFYLKIPVGHVEAGLRTPIPDEPFPEEMNRRLISRLATLHFAPTNQALVHLLYEGVNGGKVWVTGNPVVDELKRRVVQPRPLQDRYVLITCHRREALEHRLSTLLAAIDRAAVELPVWFVWPVHGNPAVQRLVHGWLGDLRANILIKRPLPYTDFLGYLEHAAVVVTDSGGVVEEAATLGVRTLIIRDYTERPEAIQAGIATLVPQGSMELLPEHIAQALARGPAAPSEAFGDGRSGERIASLLERWFSTRR
jgi:UDP-N-acetylglucosamine 2-epimerase (non-hydrolysing)